MKKVFNSVLALFLAFIMVFGGAPLGALMGLTNRLGGLNMKASAAHTWQVGDIGTFGSYPQTRVTDATLLAALNAQTLTWVSYGYYISGTQSDYMKYADITYNGSKYRAVKFTSYRPYYTTYSSSASNSYQDENGYSPNTTYWFKYEPLQWRVLDPSTGLVMCESIIDSQHFYPTNTYPTWANSSVRTWLNGLFYNTAFTSTEQSGISSSTVSTPDYNGYDGGVDTTDKLYLLSRGEVTTTSYGFSSDYSVNDEARRAQGSDYAKCQGLYVYNSAGEYYGNSIWWLRSPGSYSNFASDVYSNGYVSYCSNVSNTFIGVRPAFRISNLSSLIFTSSEAVPVTGVSLDEESLALVAGETAPLAATVEPADATDKSVAWMSSDDTVATVSQSGVVTAKAAGTATITAVAGGLFADTCEVTVTAHTWAVGDIGTYGSYPQTRVTDATLLAALNAQTLTWVSYGYYISGTQSDYMKYADITYNGSKYRAVKFTSYRPYWTYYASSASNSCQDENGYSTSTTYWFKYEPLEWRVLSTSGLLMCETIIDSQDFHPTGTYPTWANSSVRTWLNGLFYNTAFTSTEQAGISSSTVSTPDYDGYDGGVDTNDKFFLLSRGEVMTTAYGFSSDYSDYDEARRAQGSDYAKCQGLYTYSSAGEYYGNSSWWLRSPGNNSLNASYVNGNGNVNDHNGVYSTSIGVRPAFKISNLSSLIFTSSEAVPVTGVSLDEESLALVAGETAPLAATVEPADATNSSVTWSSSDDTVATVSQSGVVTAIAAGTATITVTTTDGGYTDTCEVTVTAPHTHDYTYITHRVEPTCTEDGYIQHICSCGDCYFTVLESPGHTWTLKSSTAVTCTQAGVNVYECSVCGEIKTENVPAKGHNFPADGAPYTEPTCTQDGYWTLTCVDCGEVQIIADEGSATGHSYGEGVITVAPTCTTEGEIQYTCTVCGHSYTETLPAAHTAMNDGVVTTEPTCTEDGVRTFTCADCGESYTEAIPALGHDYIYTDNHNGTHTVTCSRCGYTLTEAHQLNGRKCVCGYVDETHISVLLVQDSAPWATSTNENTLNSLVNNGYIDSWDTCKTSGLANTDLADYSVVMLANDQDTATYTTYKESNEKIADYVENGGCLLLGVCDHGWDGGEFGTTLIAGVQKGNYYDWNNSIVDFDHPIVTGELTDGKTLTDSDLRSTYCSHTYFVGSSFPEGTNVIFQDSNDRATLIEYPYGDGNVIASGLTWEYSMYRCDYAYFSPYAFDDLIVYAVSLSGYGEARLTVRFEDWDGDVLKTQRVAYGEDATAPANPARTGYTFTGWSGSCENIVLNTVITAEYSINSYTVTLLFDDEKGTATGGGTFEYGEKTALSATPADGYEFIGWYIGNTLLSNSEAYIYTVTGDASITAKFEADIPTLTKIEINTEPDKTTYFTGEYLDKTGLTLKATYSDGLTAIIDKGFTCSPTQFTSSGTKTVTVTYEGKTTSFTVTVTDIALTKIEVLTMPIKTSYLVGDTLETTGLTLTATYNNGTTQTILSGYDCDPTELNTAGTQTITVTYGGKDCTFPVTVTDDVVLTKIEIKTLPNKTSYYVGDTLDTTGLTLTATYNNGHTDTITTGFTCNPTALNTAGTQTITVTYGGKDCTFPVTVSRINASGLVIAVIPSQTYTGLEITPFLTVTYNGVPLSPVTEYTAAYTNNINAGTATVTVTGIGRYTGTKTTTFTILPRNISYAIAELIPDQEYTGSEITPEAALYDNGKTLVSGTDYTTAYADNIAVGTAKITLTGKGNYTGTKTVNFQIVRTVEPTFTVADIANQKYTGFGIRPAVKAYSKADNTRLTNTVDYTANYRNNILPGTATAAVTGRGSHSGVVDKGFGILRESIAAATAEAIPDMTETGGALTPVPVLAYKSRQLVLGVDFTAEYADNVEHGTATVTITGIGGFEGTRTLSFTIIQNTADFTVDALPDEVYTGGALTPDVIVRDGLTVLEINVDYTVSYTYNINVGYAVVTVTGTGSYSGTFTVVFRIISASIESASVPTIPNAVFNNSEITPDFGDMTITYGGVTLEINVDFKVEIYNNYDVGTATIILIGIGNFSGMIQITFNITAASASGFDVGEIADTTYTGGAITPAISVSFGGVVLRINIDYTVTYTSNINAGTATVTITGIGNFTGTKPATFTINAANASGFTVTAIPNQIYTGSAITPAISVSFGGVVLRINIDYTVTYTSNINAGTATVTITGIGNFTGTKPATFTINAANASGFTVTAIPDQTYTGSAITPTVIVKFNGMTLVLGIDYTVAYTNNINVGTATVTITGKGNYTGTKTATFNIIPSNASGFTVTAIPDQTYTGSAITPPVVVKFNGETLVLNTDYTVEYTNNTNVGIATVTITGIGNYTGTKTATFEIVTVPLEGITLSSTALSLRYKGTSKLTVTFNPTEATNKNVTWTSSNEKVATVDANGNVTAKGTGTATITATAEDGGKTASCTVTVKLVWWQWLIKIMLFGWIWY